MPICNSDRSVLVMESSKVTFRSSEEKLQGLREDRRRGREVHLL
jgi:hypothetical protein